MAAELAPADSMSTALVIDVPGPLQHLGGSEVHLAPGHREARQVTDLTGFVMWLRGHATNLIC